jgi:hypothetical protein
MVYERLWTMVLQRYEQWFCNAMNNGLCNAMNNGLWKAITNGLCNAMNNGLCIIRTDIFHTTNMVYWYSEMGGTLSHRSFSMTILFNHAYQLFQLFNFICSIYFMVVFLRDLERNFLKGFSQWRFYSTMHINFFNFSNLFVPYILWLFFWGTWREIFLKGFSQWPFYSTMHINFFNFSKLFVPYILWLFF